MTQQMEEMHALHQKQHGGLVFDACSIIRPPSKEQGFILEMVVIGN
jgi:hypothetical protein